jgi:site-specific recombinase XerD
LPAIAQTDTDAQLVDLWVRRHESPNTRRNYRRQAERFMAWIGKPLVTVRLGDLQGYLQTLEGQASATRAAATAALKSLFTFAQETGFLRFNVGKAVKSPSVKNTLAERIMPETDMLRLIGMEANPRNRALLILLYGGGLRISELCGLCWRDLAERQDGEGQATVYGKGGKTRAVVARS